MMGLDRQWVLAGAGPGEEDFSMDRQLAFEYFPKDAVEQKKKKKIKKDVGYSTLSLRSF